MEVTYTTTLDDYVAFSMHMLKRSPTMRWRVGLSWTVIPVACWISALLLVSTVPAAAATLAFGGLAYAGMYPLIQHAWVTSTIRAYAKDVGVRGVIGRTTLVLADDTLTERAEAVQSVARWQDMKGVEVVGDCTYIYVTGLLAAIVPRQGFERDEDYEAVRDFALAKLARPVEPVAPAAGGRRS